jgi:cell division protein FtsN
MNHDFAKKRPSGPKSGKPKKTSQSQTSKSAQNMPAPLSTSAWVWFLVGFVFGVFICGLAYLSGVTPEPNSFDTSATKKSKQETSSNSQDPKLRFDFYTLLPEQKIELPDVEPLESNQKSTPVSQYLLQAGSFRRLEDADRRRAELILLGMDATISDTRGNSGRWYRVQVGPFETRSKLASARSTLARRNIDTLLLKRKN